MHRLTLAPLLVVAIGGLAACGHSSAAPTAPTTSTSVSVDATTQATVNATVGQALSQAAVSGSALSPATLSLPVFSRACPGGGSVTTTFSTPVSTAPGGLATSFTASSRTEFNDCRSQNVVMRGDPALIQSSDFKTQGPTPGPPTSVTVTMQTTGALVIVSNGVESRVRFDCVSVMVLQIGSGSLPQISSTGTTTWENPVGTVVRTTGCGPTL